MLRHAPFARHAADRRRRLRPGPARHLQRPLRGPHAAGGLPPRRQRHRGGLHPRPPRRAGGVGRQPRPPARRASTTAATTPRSTTPRAAPLLYSRGFDTYFGEYRTTAAAGKGVRRAYHESVLIAVPEAQGAPRPRAARRRQEAQGDRRASTSTPPPGRSCASRRTRRCWCSRPTSPATCTPRSTWRSSARATPLAEVGKFAPTSTASPAIFLGAEPYAAHRRPLQHHRRAQAVGRLGHRRAEPRLATGARRSARRSTRSAPSATCSPRTTGRCATSRRPCPTTRIFIMVNSSRYGGGGIYNLFATFTTDNQWHQLRLPARVRPLLRAAWRTSTTPRPRRTTTSTRAASSRTSPTSPPCSTRRTSSGRRS